MGESVSTVSGWERWHPWNQRNMAPIVDWLLESAAVRPGTRLLDVACGSGLPAIPAAARVRPGGAVTAIDISAEMLAACGRLARATGVEIDLREMDAQELRFPDASFDAVTSSFGLMFCPDPVKAAAEMRRVLRPGGRFSIAVWGPRESNPFFTTIFSAVYQFVPPPPQAPSAPGMFRLGAPGDLQSVLDAAGFADVRIQQLPVTFASPSFAEHWQAFADMAPPLATAAATLPPQELARIRAAAEEALRPYTDTGGDAAVRVPALAIGATGRR